VGPPHSYRYTHGASTYMVYTTFLHAIISEKSSKFGSK
jgi:hypothetical protein